MKNFEGVTKSLMSLVAFLLVALAAGCGGGGGGQTTLSGGTPTPAAKAVTAYSLAGYTGTVNETAKTIAVTVPNGTAVTALVATFTAQGLSATVGTTAQISGVTANNFTAPVTYTITAADGSTTTYTVTVTAAAVTDKAFTAFSVGGVAGTIDEAAKTIAVTVPNGTAVTALVATFTANGAGVKVGAAAQTSAVTANDFSAPLAYTVTAADASTAIYTVTVSVASASAKAITAYSFAGFPGATGVINEAAKTIAVTVPNGTTVTALVATFTTTGTNLRVGAALQTSATTANDFTAPVAYTVTATDGTTATYTVTVTVASATAKAITAYSFAGFVGATGVINETAKTIAVTVPSGTNVTALAATFTTTGASVKIGTTVQTSTATTNNFTTPQSYIVTAADASTATYIVTVTVASATAKAITAYSFAGYSGASGTINEGAKTIAVTVPNGTDVTALAATFATTGSNVKVGTTVQTSTATTNNFTAPVTYRVTAADASFVDYAVTVTVAANSAKAITAYSFGAFTDSAGTINEAAKTIAVSVPPGTNVTALVATFATTGSNAKVGTTVQTSTATANDFTAPVPYIVTAADATTTTYTVTVTLGSGPAPILLRTAGNFVILTKTGITNVHTSAITGNIGSSPITAAAMDNVFCSEITGTIYGVDAAYTGSGATTCFAGNPGVPAVVPPDANKTLVDNAVGDMITAYNDAAGRTNGVGPFLNLGAGTVTGQTLAPGTYTWGTNVTIATDLTLNGSANDVWLFQINGTLDLATNKNILLTGGALAKNVFWQVTGTVTLNAGSHFEGIVLGQTNIALITGASINGRLMPQTAATLQSSTIVQPAP